MQEQHEWNARYDQGNTPWDTGRPDGNLVRLLAGWPKCGGQALEAGCGTGTNAVWLAQQGLEVTALDISSSAIERARQRAAEQGVECRFLAADFIDCQLESSRFDLLFDRGCFHHMEQEERRSRFASQAAACLAPGGLWFSLIGNKDQVLDGPGPPRLSAAQICASVEPWFEILRLESLLADSANQPVQLRFWQCLMRVRK